MLTNIVNHRVTIEYLVENFLRLLHLYSFMVGLQGLIDVWHQHLVVALYLAGYQANFLLGAHLHRTIALGRDNSCLTRHLGPCKSDDSDWRLDQF